MPTSGSFLSFHVHVSSLYFLFSSSIFHLSISQDLKINNVLLSPGCFSVKVRVNWDYNVLDIVVPWNQFVNKEIKWPLPKEIQWNKDKNRFHEIITIINIIAILSRKSPEKEFSSMIVSFAVPITRVRRASSSSG